MPEVNNLKEKAFKGVFWSYINKFGTQLIAILPAMVLSRLIAPEEYGLLATASIFSGIAYILSGGGFATALIQKKNADLLDYNSVFYFNVFLNTLTYFIFFLVAPYCADFFGDSRITSIMRCSLLSLPILAIGGVHAIILKRNLDFRAPAIRNIIVQSLAAIVAIIFAFLGFGVWALVIQGLAQTLGNTIFNWLLCKWRPSLSISYERIKDLFGFGSKVYATEIIEYGFGKAYDTTITKFYSFADLSYYNKAYSTCGLITDSFLGVINNVIFPVYTKIQDDIERMRFNARRLLIMNNMINFAMMSIAFVLAKPIFHFLYSSKWDICLPLFRLVCFIGLLKPIRTILDNLLLASGSSDVIMWNSIINKVFIVIVIFCSWDKGLNYMIYGQIMVVLFDIIYFSYFTNLKFRYCFYDIIKDSIPYLIVSILTAVLVWCNNEFIIQPILSFINSEIISSFIQIMLNGIVAISILFIVYKFLRIEAYLELKYLIEASTKGRFRILDKITVYL